MPPSSAAQTFSGLPSISVGAALCACAAAGTSSSAVAQRASSGRIERGTGKGPSFGPEGRQKVQRASALLVAVILHPRAGLSTLRGQRTDDLPIRVGRVAGAEDVRA